MFCRYWLDLYSISKKEVQEWFGIKWEFAKLILVFLVVAFALYKWYGLGFALNVAWGELWIDFLAVLILFFFTPFIAFFNMFRVAAIRDNSQRRKLSLKAYKDIEIVPYEYPWTANEQRLGVTGVYNCFKVGLRVTNKGGASAVNCLARMMSVKYNGLASNGEWINSPNQVDIKPLKWDEGYEPNHGRITISAKGGTGRILLAEKIPHDPRFYFVFVDGPSKSYQNLEGRYRVTMQLEGQVQREEMFADLDVILFEIEFDFLNRRLLNVTEGLIQLEEVDAT